MAVIDSARRDWEDGYRRFAVEAREASSADALHLQLAVITDELRRRVGGWFSLAELAAVYTTSEPWARVAVAEHAAFNGWERDLAVVSDAAFHLFSRGAVDFVP